MNCSLHNSSIKPETSDVIFVIAIYCFIELLSHPVLKHYGMTLLYTACDDFYPKFCRVNGKLCHAGFEPALSNAEYLTIEALYNYTEVRAWDTSWSMRTPTHFYKRINEAFSRKLCDICYQSIRLVIIRKKSGMIL